MGTIAAPRRRPFHINHTYERGGRYCDRRPRRATGWATRSSGTSRCGSDEASAGESRCPHCLPAPVLVFAPAACGRTRARSSSSPSPHRAGPEAISPALSADGRYVAFQGTIGGDEASSARTCDRARSSGRRRKRCRRRPTARHPRSRPNGRYVSFTTSAQLDPDDDTGLGSGRLRRRHGTSPPSYELVSALDGCDPNFPGAGSLWHHLQRRGRFSRFGPGRAQRRRAKVVFVTTAASDLGGVPGATPAGQVYLRDLDTAETTLVSVERDPATGNTTFSRAGGGVILGRRRDDRCGAECRRNHRRLAGRQPPGAGAAARRRERTDRLEGRCPDTPYVEPLWRRVADGARAPTRRVIGGGDPAGAGMPARRTDSAEPACQGPFPSLTTGKSSSLNAGAAGWLGPNDVNGVPQLSADGRDGGRDRQPDRSHQRLSGQHGGGP